MRNILDTCHCGGVLIPEEPLIGPPVHEAMGRIGDHYNDGPRSTATLISLLSCNKCGLLYKAAVAGQTREMLRKEAYQDAPKLEAEPDACTRCNASKLEHEYAHGPYGVNPKTTELHTYEDPRKHRIGVYCLRCNSVLGTLPPDPLAVEKYDEKNRAFQARIDAAHKSGERVMRGLPGLEDEDEY